MARRALSAPAPRWVTSCARSRSTPNSSSWNTTARSFGTARNTIPSASPPATPSRSCILLEEGEVTTLLSPARPAEGLDTLFVIAGREFRSRLLVGTGKYASNDAMVRAIDASGAEVVTVAVRRVNLDRTRDEGILYHLDPSRFFLLANTAGCYTADEAVRYARLARAAGLNDWVKLEVIGDQRTLLPDVMATLEAARTLVAEGFKVLAYTNEDVVMALRLEDAGCAAVMPLASPIGSGLGLLNPLGVRTIKRRLTV